MSLSVVSEMLFWAGALLCVVAQGAVVRAALAGRTPGASTSIASKVREIVWVILPAVLLGVVLVWTWRSLPSRGAVPITPVVGHPSPQRPHREMQST